MCVFVYVHKYEGRLTISHITCCNTRCTVSSARALTSGALIYGKMVFRENVEIYKEREDLKKERPWSRLKYGSPNACLNFEQAL